MSRIPFSEGYKSPIHAGNINTIVSVFNDTTDYIKTLKCDGSPLVLGGRKMFILGFIVTMSSTIQIAYILLYRSQSLLKFILTYKMSQDHLEIFYQKYYRGKRKLLSFCYSWRGCFRFPL